MRDLVQEYKAFPLLFPAAITATTSSTTVADVEIYNDDAVAVVTIGAVGAGGSAIVTITGSLVATPTTYDQTLATFVSAATAYTTAAGNVTLTGIKNVKATATLPASTSIAVEVVLLAQAFEKSSTLNSLTAA
jgi:hypothetical protein